MKYFLLVDAQSVAQYSKRIHKSIAYTDSIIDRIVGNPCIEGNDIEYVYQFDNSKSRNESMRRIKPIFKCRKSNM